jgi:hypothetical protein
MKHPVLWSCVCTILIDLKVCLTYQILDLTARLPHKQFSGHTEVAPKLPFWELIDKFRPLLLAPRSSTMSMELPRVTDLHGRNYNNFWYKIVNNSSPPSLVYHIQCGCSGCCNQRDSTIVLAANVGCDMSAGRGKFTPEMWMSWHVGDMSTHLVKISSLNVYLPTYILIPTYRVGMVSWFCVAVTACHWHVGDMLATFAAKTIVGHDRHWSQYWS